MIEPAAQQILDYWLGDAALSPEHANEQKKLWYRSSAKIDIEIKAQFSVLHERAVTHQLDHWMEQPESCLALVILLDQFSRHLYRGLPGAFAQDDQALEAAAKCPAPSSLPYIGRAFLLHPYEHSEHLEAQQESLKHFSQLVEDADEFWRPMMQNFLEHATEHQSIVLQFGRFPHRNDILGRQSTPDEIAYLRDSGKTFGQTAKKNHEKEQ